MPRLPASRKLIDVIIVTRNTKHFQVFGVGVVSPDETTHAA